MRRTAVPLSGALVFMLAAGFAGASGAAYPSSEGYVTDQAGIIAPAELAAADALARELEARTGAQVALVTVETTAPETIEQYSANLFERWGIGRRERDDGLLVLVARRDRAVKIEVGYGLEGVIPDARAHQVISRVILPAFRRGEFGPGLVAALAVLAGDIAADAGVELASLSDGTVAAGASVLDEPTRRQVIFSKIVFIFLLFFIMAAFGPLGLLFFGAGTNRRGGYWSGGGFGGGGFGGGFGGFGGGMSGGGGAVGRW